MDVIDQNPFNINQSRSFRLFLIERRTFVQYTYPAKRFLRLDWNLSHLRLLFLLIATAIQCFDSPQFYGRKRFTCLIQFHL